MPSHGPHLPYDASDSKDIERYAKLLLGKSFHDACNEQYINGAGSQFDWNNGSTHIREKGDYSSIKCKLNKGHLGQYLEKNYFFYEPNSNKDPDFKDAGVELKVSPLKKLSSGKLRAKERIVLSIINYMDVVDEEWSTSSFLYKNSLLLLIFYLYEKGIDRLDYLIKMVTLWGYGEADMEIIRDDWEKIVGKIREGRAHELSEGDTIYLGACTKGVNRKSLRKQPFSEELAKQRAFSLKQKYVNYIISASSDAEPAIKDVDELKSGKTFEELVLDRLVGFLGKAVTEVHDTVGNGLNPKAKNYYSTLAARMLGVKKNKIEEFEKGGISIKTIRLKKNGTPKEDMSFPYFKYKELVEETWDDSTLLERLDRKFFFMVFQYDEDDVLRFKKGMFWNIPYDDLKEVEKVWKETVKRIKDGRAEDLPKKSENRVSHVRPHARDSKDTCETPYGQHLVKKSFWLNSRYLKEQIEKDYSE